MHGSSPPIEKEQRKVMQNQYLENTLLKEVQLFLSKQEQREDERERQASADKKKLAS